MPWINLLCVMLLTAACSSPSAPGATEDGRRRGPALAPGQSAPPFMAANQQADSPPADSPPEDSPPVAEAAAEEAASDPSARPLRAPPGTPRGPDRADTDDRDFPPDAADYLTGPKLRGTLRSGETGQVLAGCTVNEHHEGAASVKTGADGVFLLTLMDEERPAVLARCDGHVPTLQVVDAQSRLYFDGEFKVEMFERADEDAAFLEDFGVARDPAEAMVMLNFQPQGVPSNVAAALDPPGGQGWVYGVEDKPTKGHELGSKPGMGEIVFPGLAPGDRAVQVTAPAPLECGGPATVPALADTITRAYYFCARPGETPAPPAGE